MRTGIGQFNLKKTILSWVFLLITIGITQLTWAMSSTHLEHQHSANTWMFEYQFMRMQMKNLLKGSDDVNPDKVAKMPNMGGLGFMMSPTEMTMDMHMLMPMYNFTSALSVMAMFNYLNNSMDMVAMDKTTSTMASSGLGDTSVSVNYKFADDQLVAGLALSIPTGSIEESGDMKMSAVMTMRDVRFPYPMQLGSGTYDLMPSLTYLDGMYEWNWGGQLRFIYRVGENDSEYALGNQATAKAWIKRPVGRFVLSGNVSYQRWGAISGQDPDIMPVSMNMGGMKTSPLAATSSSGGTLGEATIGMSTFLGLTTVGIDVGVPFIQDLNGIQMKRQWTAAFSINAMF